ncbi:MAG: ATP-dependent helicase [Fuerstiella sp.]
MSAESGSTDVDFLKHLNAQQRSAVTHGAGPLLIVAGAGTGKTTTLAHRVAWQIISGISPERIWLLTFSRRSAADMMRRVDAILSHLDRDALPAGVADGVSLQRIRGGTFHSMAANLLRRHGQLIGLYPDFTILDRGDSEDLMNLGRAELDLPKSPKRSKQRDRFPLKATCVDIYSRCVNTQQKLEPVLIQWFPWCLPYQEKLAELFRRYADLKEQQRVLDFDDLLLFWNALAQHQDGGDVLRQQFDRVLVDEYQDTNVLEAEILKNLVPDGTGLTVVGDDAQSIYSFRAATVRNILDFPTDFPGTEVIPLEQNYRSLQSILKLTNGVIAEAKERHHKELWSARGEGQPPALVTCGDEDAQTDFLIDAVLEQREKGVLLREQAVLFRASHHSMSLEAELGRRDIPFRKFGGLRFLEAAHIKDLLSFLRLAENPLDAVSGLRALILLPGIGQTKARGLLNELRETGGQFDCWLAFKPPSATRDIWPKFVQLLQNLTGRRTSPAGGLGAELHAARIFYTPLLEARYENPRPRLNDLQQLEVMAGRYRDRASFLSEMTLDPPSSTQDLAADPQLDDDYLVLSTIHSAKGLEWDAVYVIHAADGNIPADQATGSDEDIEEERRLFYVALTRARNQLCILRPERYYFQNRRRSDFGSLSQLTRFLPAAIQKLCAVQSFGDVLGDVFTPDATGLTSSDTTEIRNRLNRLWS